MKDEYSMALAAMMALCSRREYCSKEIERKLSFRNLSDGQRKRIIDQLQKEKFLDDGRYAEFFVNDKSRISGWGRRKIAYALSAKGISQNLIESALEGMDSESNAMTLERVLKAKSRSLKESDPVKRREKLVRFALGRGFDYAEILDVLKKTVL